MHDESSRLPQNAHLSRRAALTPKCLLETVGWRDGFVASLRSLSGCSRSACRPVSGLAFERSASRRRISPWCGSREERARTVRK